MLEDANLVTTNNKRTVVLVTNLQMLVLFGAIRKVVSVTLLVRIIVVVEEFFIRQIRLLDLGILFKSIDNIVLIMFLELRKRHLVKSFKDTFSKHFFKVFQILFVRELEKPGIHLTSFIVIPDECRMLSVEDWVHRRFQ